MSETSRVHLGDVVERSRYDIVSDTMVFRYTCVIDGKSQHKIYDIPATIYSDAALHLTRENARDYFDNLRSVKA